jgi:hypothetical protein
MSSLPIAWLLFGFASNRWLNLWLFVGVALTYPDKIATTLANWTGRRSNWRHIVACELVMLILIGFGCWLSDRSRLLENIFWMGIGALFRPAYAFFKDLVGLKDE